MATEPPLSQGAGYGVVLGVGFAFAIGMILTTSSLRRYQKEVITSEEFATAGRTVKTGLVAAAVVSSWTWAATLAQSSTEGYLEGVSGPFWYASGATVQIILFATIAIELKRKAPGAHTYLEIIKARYGTVAHCVYMFFAIATNILVTAMLFTGGSAIVNNLTGMNVVAGCYLLPLGVMIYTLFGGLKATFLTDYIHTVIILVIILIFAFTTYATNDQLGSPGKVWDILTELAKTEPVEGNAHGSFLTMASRNGGIFFVINIAGNFGTVFLDNGYWNKAIAASPVAALPGYILGGLSWFAIPWLCATTFGLAARALEHTPSFPTYPEIMSSADVSAGLVLPNTAVALLGKGGAGAALLLVFMAVTSASSAELVSVSSICTYDVYKSYINPNASGKKLIFVTHFSVVVYTLILSSFSTGLHYAGVGMGYLYLLMGVIISSAVIPASLSLLWSGQSRITATVTPVLGLIFAIVAWMATTKGLFDEVNVTTSGSNMPMLAGNVVALCSPLVIIPVLTLIFGIDHYDFSLLKNLKTIRDVIGDEDPEHGNPEYHKSPEVLRREELEEVKEMELLNKYAKIARIACCVMALALIILWPMPMYGSHYIFSKKFFTGWIVVGILWMFLSLFAVGIFPLWEARMSIYYTLRGIYWDCTGQSSKLYAWQNTHPELLHHGYYDVQETEGTAISDEPVTEEILTEKKD